MFNIMMKKHEAHPCFDTILWGGLPNPVTTSAGWGWVAGEPYHHPQRGFFPHHHHPFFLSSSSFCLFVLDDILMWQRCIRGDLIGGQRIIPAVSTLSVKIRYLFYGWRPNLFIKNTIHIGQVKGNRLGFTY
jgi:hypothetical protein